MDSQNVVDFSFQAGMVAPELIPYSGFEFLSRRPVPIVNRASLERTAISLFVARVKAVGDLRHASLGTRLRVLDAVRALVPAIDVSACASSASHYGRRVLWDDPAGWSLAAISLIKGQQTEAHDHAGWGGAVTVQGIERDQRYRMDAAGDLQLVGQRDYSPGMGYHFGPSDIHQPIGADPRRLTIALHFLVHDRDSRQHRHEAHPNRPDHGRR